jgi:hypothetical protein
MTMSGEQWLDQVLRPTVAGVIRARQDQSIGVVTVDPLRVLGGQLHAQVEALGDTGVLTDEQERAALDAIEAAGIMPEIRSVSMSMSSESAGEVRAVAARVGSVPVAARPPVEPPTLRRVVAGPRELGRLDGRPVTLISAELWSNRFTVDLYTDPGPDHRAEQARETRDRLEWMRRLRRGQDAPRPGNVRVESPLRALRWELHDEHGTEYRRGGGAAESTHDLDRLRLGWSVPFSVTPERLTLVATNASGTSVLTAEIPGAA